MASRRLNLTVQFPEVIAGLDELPPRSESLFVNYVLQQWFLEKAGNRTFDEALSDDTITSAIREALLHAGRARLESQFAEIERERSRPGRQRRSGDHRAFGEPDSSGEALKSASRFETETRRETVAETRNETVTDRPRPSTTDAGPDWVPAQQPARQTVIQWQQNVTPNRETQELAPSGQVGEDEPDPHETKAVADKLGRMFDSM